MDTRIQSRGNMINTYLKYPFVLGYDMAGEIVEVGEDVTDLNINDRILALSRAGDKAINDPAQGAFQKCAIAFQDFTTKLPPNIDYAHAAVIPLSVITAAAALFDSTQLVLELPVVPKRSATGQTVLIWGGSTSVGCSAIQLAVSARYEVFATAGLKNQKKLRELGATKIWDYSSRTAVKDIVAALSGKELAGIVSIGSGAANKCIDIVKSVDKGQKFVSMVSYPVPEKDIQTLGVLRTVVGYISALLSYKIRSFLYGFKYNLVEISVTMDNGIAKYIFKNYLPQALVTEDFKPMPEPKLVGNGLENIQEGFKELRDGVTMTKLIVKV